MRAARRNEGEEWTRSRAWIGSISEVDLVTGGGERGVGVNWQEGATRRSKEEEAKTVARSAYDRVKRKRKSMQNERETNDNWGIETGIRWRTVDNDKDDDNHNLGKDRWNAWRP